MCSNSSCDRCQHYFDRLPGHPSAILDVRLLSNGGVITASTAKTVRMWDGQTGESSSILPEHAESVNGVAVFA